VAPFVLLHFRRRFVTPASGRLLISSLARERRALRYRKSCVLLQSFYLIAAPKKGSMRSKNHRKRFLIFVAFLCLALWAAAATIVGSFARTDGLHAKLKGFKGGAAHES